LFKASTRFIQMARIWCALEMYLYPPIILYRTKVGGLWHSAGHEGAGSGLAPGSAALITDAILGKESFMDCSPFSPRRFARVAV